MVMEVVDEDMEGLGMACTDHPYKTQTAGGICAFCLQDKLGKLVSSSFPSAIFPAAASSLSSPSSDPAAAAAAAVKHTPRAKQSFLGKSHHDVSIVFQRSKSTAAGSRPRGFWSFLARDGTRLPGIGSSFRHRSLRERREREIVADCNTDNDERKVSRSRSVGCGSRSFSGDFFERLSTGLGDCALRRVESQREGKPKNTPVHGPRDRVRCGGIFGSFSSSSTTSSSSSATNFPHHAPPVPLAAHGRSRSWGWALASPMRAFSSNKTKRGRENGGGKRPNLNAIPSILSVGGG